MLNLEQIRQHVETELAQVPDSARRAVLQAALVPPELLCLKWDYSQQEVLQYDCWLVALSTDGQQRILYCDQGHGPSYPWGIVSIHDDWLGRDDSWHLGLEHAAIGAGILPAPADYVVP